jgi:uncharacterized YccA/Bax inhibitor family protein
MNYILIGTLTSAIMVLLASLIGNDWNWDLTTLYIFLGGCFVFSVSLWLVELIL